MPSQYDKAFLKIVANMMMCKKRALLMKPSAKKTALLKKVNKAIKLAPIHFYG